MGIPRGDENGSYGNPAGTEFVFAGTPRVRFRNLADDKNSGAGIRTLGKLCREISYVAAKCVVDSWSIVFSSWRKKTTFRRLSTAVPVHAVCGT